MAYAQTFDILDRRSQVPTRTSRMGTAGFALVALLLALALGEAAVVQHVWSSADAQTQAAMVL